MRVWRLSTVNNMTKDAPTTAAARRRDHLRAVSALDRHAPVVEAYALRRTGSLRTECSPRVRMAPPLRNEERDQPRFTWCLQLSGSFRNRKCSHRYSASERVSVTGVAVQWQCVEYTVVEEESEPCPCPW